MTCMNEGEEPPKRRRVRVRLIFVWYDMWVGAYWNRRRRTLYVFLLPMCGIAIEFPMKYAEASAYDLYK